MSRSAEETFIANFPARILADSYLKHLKAAKAPGN